MILCCLRAFASTTLSSASSPTLLRPGCACDEACNVFPLCLSILEYPSFDCVGRNRIVLPCRLRNHRIGFEH